MNKLFVTLISVFAFGAIKPALAGPNWEIIEQGRKNAQERQVKEKMTQEQMMRTCQEMMKNK